MIQIIGKGGFGRELAAYCEAFNIPSFQFEKECNGMHRGADAVIAIGNEEIRTKVTEQFPNQSWGVINFGKNYGFPYNKINRGCIICPGTIITVNVTLGMHCLVNINCTIGHDVFIGDFCTINPGVNISGNVSIGANCNIGSNAVIKNGIKICDDVIIGAGGVVVKDITEPGIYVGNPVERLDRRYLKSIELDIKLLRHDTDLLIKKTTKLDAENSLHRPIK
jgi:sugar O-acyltransferase (sialic acid O-acetyltransferase NeuD family)